MEFGQRLQHVRHLRKLSQYKLSKETGIAQSYLSRLEAGKRPMETMTLGMALRLAKALRISMDYLCGLYEDDNLKEGAVAVWIGVWLHNGHRPYAFTGHALFSSIAKSAREVKV